jgi:hypothetical protein
MRAKWITGPQTCTDLSASQIGITSNIDARATRCLLIRAA